MRYSRKEAYGKRRADLKNIGTIFILGDDDDDFPMSIHTRMKAKFLGEKNNSRYSSPKTVNLSGPNDVKTTDDSSLQQQPFMSNYIRGVKAKVKHLFNKVVLPLNTYILNITYSIISRAGTPTRNK